MSTHHTPGTRATCPEADPARTSRTAATVYHDDDRFVVAQKHFSLMLVVGHRRNTVTLVDVRFSEDLSHAVIDRFPPCRRVIAAPPPPARGSPRRTRFHRSPGGRRPIRPCTSAMCRYGPRRPRRLARSGSRSPAPGVLPRHEDLPQLGVMDALDGARVAREGAPPPSPVSRCRGSDDPGHQFLDALRYRMSGSRSPGVPSDRGRPGAGPVR